MSSGVLRPRGTTEASASARTTQWSEFGTHGVARRCNPVARRHNPSGTGLGEREDECTQLARRVVPVSARRALNPLADSAAIPDRPWRIRSRTARISVESGRNSLHGAMNPERRASARQRGVTCTPGWTDRLRDFRGRTSALESRDHDSIAAPLRRRAEPRGVWVRRSDVSGASDPHSMYGRSDPCVG